MDALLLCSEVIAGLFWSAELEDGCGIEADLW